jgi:carboxyl-terminal processing protease
MKNRFAIVLILIVLLSALIGGFVGAGSTAKASAATSYGEFLANYTEALDVIQKNYMHDVNPDSLVYSSIKGMLRILDPHSDFMEPKTYAKMRDDQRSRYFGLGIRIRTLTGEERGRCVIVEPPSPGTPAYKNGLRAGDIITKIEGEYIDNWTQDDVVGKLKGPRGTIVNISIERHGVGDLLEMFIERDEIPLVTVPYAFEIRPGIGYIKMDRFAETTTDELKKTLDSMKGISGLILDLRDNGGGLLNQAISVSGFFLPRGELVVSTRGRAEGSVRRYDAGGSETLDIPLVVLINSRSASASEIVAGALQDHDRALIVGETSFGKGLVQSVYTMSNNTGMMLVTAKYYTPSGRLIQRDYSNSLFEYYNIVDTAEPDTQKDKGREIRYTDNDRTVYGGGGITPDVIETARTLNRFESLLRSKDVFFQYTQRLTAGEVSSAQNFKLPEEIAGKEKPANGKNVNSDSDFIITEEIFRDFRQFLIDRNIAFTEEDLTDNSEFIKRQLRQSVFTSHFGIQEGYIIGIEGDNQVQKALTEMSAAKALMASGRF